MARELSNSHADSQKAAHKTGPADQRLRGVDNLWLMLVRAVPAFNPVCASTYCFDRQLDIESLKEALHKQCATFPKYRQKLAVRDKLFHPPFYVDDPDFSLDRHLQVVELPEPAGPRELDAFVSDYISQKWDETRPLWSAAYIPNYKDGSTAKAAMVSRGNHSQSDGQGFILSALYVTSFGNELEAAMKDGTAKLHHVRTGTLPPDEVSPSLRHLMPLWGIQPFRPIIQLGLFFAYWLFFAGDTIVRLFWSGLHLVYQLYYLFSTFWRIETVVPARPGPRQASFAVSKPLKLSEVKTMQRAFSGSRPGPSQSGSLGHEHVTVNDLLCAIMSDVVHAAIRRNPEQGRFQILKAIAGAILPMPIAFFIPISVRDPGQWDMRNLSTGAIAYLSYLPHARPTVQQLHHHIHRCKTSLNFVKRSFLPLWAFEIIQFLGQYPILFYPFWSDGIFACWPFVALREALFSSIIGLVPAVVTNIPGPPAEADMAGSRILRWTALPPQAGRGTAGIGIITYNGSVSVTVAVDRIEGFEDAAERMCRDFERRFKLYLAAAEGALGERYADVVKR